MATYDVWDLLETRRCLTAVGKALVLNGTQNRPTTRLNDTALQGAVDDIEAYCHYVHARIIAVEGEKPYIDLSFELTNP